MNSIKIPFAPISKPMEASAGKTGLWRFLKPEIDVQRCIKCGICWMYCPDAVIVLDEEGVPHIDYEYCKGCGICANECPVKAIKMVREEGKP